jgi:hypothetical protein
VNFSFGYFAECTSSWTAFALLGTDLLEPGDPNSDTSGRKSEVRRADLPSKESYQNVYKQNYNPGKRDTLERSSLSRHKRKEDDRNW